MSDSEEDPIWDVALIDPGCDCCSYVSVGTFSSQRKAESYVARTGNPREWYSIEEF